MKAYTNGEKVYFIDSFGPNCWKHIWAARLSDWGKPQIVAWPIDSNGWTTDQEAENVLENIAKTNGWIAI